jgi:probable F420-dependent oxidoreductase
MRIGIIPRYVTPNLTDPGWLREWTAAVESAGVESVWTVEHVAVPAVIESEYPYTPDGKIRFSADVPFPDPLDSLAFVAGLTSLVRLGTAVVILPVHHPIQLAKRCATVDALSGGRLMLGVGVGWMREGFDALGVPFSKRGARAEEYVAVMRHLWSQDPEPFNGEFVSFEALRVDPAPVQAGGPPIIIGGSSRTAARRAGRIGDGYYPAAMKPAELEVLLSEVRDAATRARRDPDTIEITVRPAGATPLGSFDKELVRGYQELGVHRMVIGSDEADGARPEDVLALIDRVRNDVLG